jgi:hypothetical protein
VPLVISGADVPRNSSVNGGNLPSGVLGDVYRGVRRVLTFSSHAPFLWLVTFSTVVGGTTQDVAPQLGE